MMKSLHTHFEVSRNNLKAIGENRSTEEVMNFNEWMEVGLNQESLSRITKLNEYRNK